MRFRPTIALGIAGLSVLTATYAFQRGGFRQYLDEEDNPAAVPADAGEKTEYQFARLRYSSSRGRYRGYGSWGTDFPKADRQFLQGVRRLSRIHARSVEEVVDLESDKIFDYPWVYAVEVGRWGLSTEQAKKLREYLLRGGFLMADDFHGTAEWEEFMAGMSTVFPDRPVVEIDNKDEIFQVLYDLDERVQVPGIQYFWSGSTWEKDGVEPHWRGIYDDKGRLMVGICFNMDLGDAWEWADHPRYPEKWASLAYRIGINYIIYSMTH
jgi:hypothetical protein